MFLFKWSITSPLYHSNQKIMLSKNCMDSRPLFFTPGKDTVPFQEDSVFASASEEQCLAFAKSVRSLHECNHEACNQCDQIGRFFKVLNDQNYQYLFMQKQSKCLLTFQAFLKHTFYLLNTCYFLGNCWKQIGLLFISTSGHTACNSVIIIHLLNQPTSG